MRQVRVGGNFLGPRILQRIEGGVLLALSVFFYARNGGSWWIFALLLLAPDISALGYLAGNVGGAAVYNLFHNYALPGILVTVGILSGVDLAVWVALIWFAHIGMDRLLGYGLKYPDSCGDTHLGKIGKERLVQDAAA